VSAPEITKYGRDLSGECVIVSPKGGIIVGAGVADGRSVVIAAQLARVWMS